jgi:methyl-accepting chemotaxis protein
VAESGIETEDTPLIRHCIATAGDIAASVRAADRCRQDVDVRSVRRELPADPRHRSVQHMTRFVQHTDRLLPAFQEAMLDFDPRVTFCAAIDRNGFLPTHNHIYSQPQSAGSGLERRQLPQPPHLQRSHRARRGPQHQAVPAADLPPRHGRRQLHTDEGPFRPDRGQRPHWGGLRIGFKINV